MMNTECLIILFSLVSVSLLEWLHHNAFFKKFHLPVQCSWYKFSASWTNMFNDATFRDIVSLIKHLFVHEMINLSKYIGFPNFLCAHKFAVIFKGFRLNCRYDSAEKVRKTFFDKVVPYSKATLCLFSQSVILNSFGDKAKNKELLTF